MYVWVLEEFMKSARFVHSTIDLLEEGGQLPALFDRMQSPVAGIDLSAREAAITYEEAL